MGPREAITVCLQDYVRLRGRARRPEFWWWTAAVVPSQLALDWADDGVWGEDRLLGFGGLFFWLTLIPGISVQWRRLQDTGIPGWIVLVPIGLALVQGFMPYTYGDKPVLLIVSALRLVSEVLIFVGCLLPSQPGRNIFGEEPPRRPIRWDL